MVTGGTWGSWYRTIRRRLTEAGCDSPAFDALCLLEDVGGMPRGALSLWENRPVEPAAARRLEEAAAQREKRRPLQYILGQWDFLDLTLEVGEGVLVPRPDTELLCESAAGWLQGKQNPRVLDLCAGSGCVGLGIARLFPGAQVTAVELSEEALSYLRRNAARYPQYPLTIIAGDALDGGTAEGAFDAVVSNPPYIPEGEPVMELVVDHEPHLALFAGEDGLACYRRIVAEAQDHLVPGGWLFLEHGMGQSPAVTALLSQRGFVDVETYQDMEERLRVVGARRRRA